MCRGFTRETALRGNEGGTRAARKTSDFSVGLTRVEERDGRKEGWVEKP